MLCHYCYDLYACDHCFVLKRGGEDGCREFPTIFDAIVHIENLPESDGSTLCIHNELGHTIGQLLLNCGTLCGETVAACPFQPASSPHIAASS